jgi:hypothetical protein
MATDKPRITITLEQDQYLVLKRMADLQGGSMSRIVSDLLSEVVPVLNSVCDSLELAKKAQDDVRANLRRVAEEAQNDLEPIARMFSDQFDMFASELERLASDASQQAAEDDATREPGSDRRARRGAGVGASEAVGPRSVITGATGSATGHTHTIDGPKKRRSRSASPGVK